jgi:hypothetical protein
MKSSTIKFVYVKSYDSENGKYKTSIFEHEVNRRESLVMTRTENISTGTFSENVVLVELGPKFLGLDPTPQYEPKKDTRVTEN